MEDSAGAGELGGGVALISGAGPDRSGDIWLSGGASHGIGCGGSVSLEAGSGGSGGSLLLQSGSSNEGIGGNVRIAAGASASCTGGSATLGSGASEQGDSDRPWSCPGQGASAVLSETGSADVAGGVNVAAGESSVRAGNTCSGRSNQRVLRIY